MRNYAREFAELPSGVLRFIATESLLGIGIGILNLILNLHLLAIGMNPRDIGANASAGTLAMGLASFPSGALATRFGRKTMLVLGLGLMALAFAGFGLGRSQTDMLLAQLGWSIGMTFLITSEIQLLFQYCAQKRQETQAYSLLFAIFTLFTGVGTLVGGFLPGWLGGVTTSYQYTFYAGAAFIALAACLRGLLLPGSGQTKPPRPSSPAPPTEPQPSGTAAAPAPDRSLSSLRKLLTLSVSMFLLGFTFNLASPYLNIIIQYRFHWSDQLISLLLSVVGVSLFVGSLLMPVVFERLGSTRAFALMFALNAVLVFTLGIPVGTGTFAAVLVIRGGCFSLLNNMIDSETMSAVSERDRNRFAGMRSMFRSAGSAFAAYTGGAVLEEHATLLPFTLTGAGLLLGWAWLAWVALPHMRRSKERAELEL